MEVNKDIRAETVQQKKENPIAGEAMGSRYKLRKAHTTLRSDANTKHTRSR